MEILMKIPMKIAMKIPMTIPMKIQIININYNKIWKLNYVTLFNSPKKADYETMLLSKIKPNTAANGG